MPCSLHRRRLLFLLALLALTPSCGPPSVAAPIPLRVYASSAASPWLGAVYDCAGLSLAIVLVDEASADLVLRVGEPEELVDPAFQIGSEDLIVVTHPEVGVGALTADQVEALFAGQIANWTDVGGADLPVQVWVFAASVDIQQVFDQTMLHERPVDSLARLAFSGQHMSDSVGATAGSVGLLTRRWRAGNTREVFKVATLPVLAVAREPLERSLSGLLSCVQAGS
jgi:hypothetical protein